MASELIIQLQNKDGSFNCEKYNHLPTPKSVYIAICYTDTNRSEQLAKDLKTKLISSIANLESDFSSAQPPCSGSVKPFGGCQALAISDNLKLLIVVSDGTTSSIVNSSLLSWSDTILPVLKVGSPVILPPPFNAPQVAFWSTDIEEVIPSIYGVIGVSDEDQRIFISYRRTDTAELAEQLFDRLNHEGFEVFLDRFSIRPGVNFQNRLYQELADKAMVIFLESPSFLDSEWVKLEIAFAKKYRLGLLALNINASKKIISIDDEYRRSISVSGITGRLSTSNLDSLVNDIKQQHSIALYRMKNYLNNNIIAALQSKGASTSFDSNGFISVTDKAGKLEYKIWATARPPMINDYHYSDISHTTGVKIIFGPEFREEKREVLNTWLSKKSAVDYYNEGEIMNLINLIYP